MRCKYCGSTAVSESSEKINFSAGKAVTGAVVFGPVGVAAGFMGKDRKGYRCGACGTFMQAPMDALTSGSIDGAIRDAEAGRDRSLYDFLKVQYPNIQANIPENMHFSLPAKTAYTELNLPSRDINSGIKHVYRCNTWIPDCPVYIEKIIIKTGTQGDTFSLVAFNQSQSSLRSIYYQLLIYDDADDEIGTTECVYQGLEIKARDCLPQDKEFPLNTELAYRVSVKCQKAVYTNGTVWRCDNSPSVYVLSEQTSLTENNFHLLKYVKAELCKNNRFSKDTPLFLPTEHDGFWQCICGHPVVHGKPCPNCGSDYNSLQSLLSQKHLKEEQMRIVKKRASERAKKTLSAYNSSKTLKVQKIYEEAIKLQDSGTKESLKQAEMLFQSISPWSDSDARLQQCVERIAELEKRQAELEDKKRNLESELSKLKGLFSGRRRKQLESQIAELLENISSL